MPDEIPTITASRFRSKFTAAWLTCLERRAPLLVTANGRPDFVIFPIKAAVPMVKRSVVAEFSIQVFRAVTGIEPDTDWYEPPVTSPDTMRRFLGEERRRFRSLMRPFVMTYYNQVAAILFPIPHDGDMDTVRKFQEVWYAEG